MQRIATRFTTLHTYCYNDIASKFKGEVYIASFPGLHNFWLHKERGGPGIFILMCMTSRVERW